MSPSRAIIRRPNPIGQRAVIDRYSQSYLGRIEQNDTGHWIATDDHGTRVPGTYTTSTVAAAALVQHHDGILR